MLNFELKMTINEKIAEISAEYQPSFNEDLTAMKEDIYYYFSQMEDFEVLRVEQTNDENRMVVAVCISTLEDPFFKLVVAHTWQKDLAFDAEWSEFEDNELGTVFRFLTWEDGYISGEIWFERGKQSETE